MAAEKNRPTGTSTAVPPENHAALGFSDREIVATRILNAPPDLVFSMWTNPKHLAQWWGPRGFTTSTQEMDVRPGGTWRHVMHGPDGVDYPNHTVFIEVVKPHRLVYTNVGGKKGGLVAKFQATVTFEEQGGRTKLTMRMLFESAALRDQLVIEYGVAEGLSQTLDRLTEQLMKAPVTGDRAEVDYLEEMARRHQQLPRPRLCYLEIPAVDVHRSAAFYGEVFGWDIRGRDTDRPSFAYPSTDVTGAWVAARAISNPPGLLPYIWVDRIDEALAQIAAHGGQVVQPPHLDSPGGQWIATFRDPAGNVIGLYQEGPR